MNNKILPSGSKFIFEPHIALENKLPCMHHVNLMHSVGIGNIHENIELLYIISGKVKQVRLTEIKTKKGKTYKAQPVLKTSKKEETTKNEEKNDNDLPF